CRRNLNPVRLRQPVHFVAAQFAVKELFARSEPSKSSHQSPELNCHVERSETSLIIFGGVHHSNNLRSFASLRMTQTAGYFATIPTKSRTGFCPAIENTRSFSRANQNALDEPPSRFIARRILDFSATGAVA